MGLEGKESSPRATGCCPPPKHPQHNLSQTKASLFKMDGGTRHRCCTKASHICFSREGGPLLLFQQADGKATLKTSGAECCRLAGKLGRGEREEGNLAAGGAREQQPPKTTALPP